MSLDKSLKLSSTMKRHRNVLSRSERLAFLEREEKWKVGDSVFGLPKVRTVKVRRRHKAAKEEAAPVAGAAPPMAEGQAAAAEAKPAAGAKGRAAKAAAPTAKAPAGGRAAPTGKAAPGGKK